MSCREHPLFLKDKFRRDRCHSPASIFLLMRRLQSASVTTPDTYCLDRQDTNDKNRTMHLESALKFKKSFYCQYLTRFSDQSCNRNKIHSFIVQYHVQLILLSTENTVINTHIKYLPLQNLKTHVRSSK